jgi:hypothetical protein
MHGTGMPSAKAQQKRKPSNGTNHGPGSGKCTVSDVAIAASMLLSHRDLSSFAHLTQICPDHKRYSAAILYLTSAICPTCLAGPTPMLALLALPLLALPAGLAPAGLASPTCWPCPCWPYWPYLLVLLALLVWWP